MSKLSIKEINWNRHDRYIIIKESEGDSPRGEWYKYIEIHSKGFIVYGEEQGNYSGYRSKDIYNYSTMSDYDSLYMECFKRDYPEGWKAFILKLTQMSLLDNFKELLNL